MSKTYPILSVTYMKVVMAVGGNALLEKYDKGAAPEQIRRAEETAYKTIEIFRDNDVILTHGNGPQVGAIMLQNEYAASLTPPMPLDVCDAMSQGSIAYFLQTAFGKVLKEKKIEKNIAGVVTRVLVDKDDPAFKNPTKPVGKYYTREEASILERTYGYKLKEDSGRGYRRVVPSPMPKKIIELKIIKDILEKGDIPIAVGGGGIPVIETTDGLTGVEAVIDKDLASSLLAAEIDADIFIILTAVKAAFLNYGKPNQEKLGEISVEKLKKFIEEGHFGSGSMLPKVEAAIQFTEKTGRKSIITDASHLYDALKGNEGTIITL